MKGVCNSFTCPLLFPPYFLHPLFSELIIFIKISEEVGVPALLLWVEGGFSVDWGPGKLWTELYTGDLSWLKLETGLGMVLEAADVIGDLSWLRTAGLGSIESVCKSSSLRFISGLLLWLESGVDRPLPLISPEKKPSLEAEKNHKLYCIALVVWMDTSELWNKFALHNELITAF